MFDELVESSAVRKKTNTGWAVILSTVVQVGVLVVLILIPLIYTQALPKALLGDHAHRAAASARLPRLLPRRLLRLSSSHRG